MHGQVVLEWEKTWNFIIAVNDSGQVTFLQASSFIYKMS